MLKMERNAIDLFKKYKNIDYKKEYDNLVYDKVLYEVNKKTNEVCSEYGRYDKYYDERNKMFNRTSHYKKGKLLKEKPDVDSYWIYYYQRILIRKSCLLYSGWEELRNSVRQWCRYRVPAY